MIAIRNWWILSSTPISSRDDGSTSNRNSLWTWNMFATRYMMTRNKTVSDQHNSSTSTLVDHDSVFVGRRGRGQHLPASLNTAVHPISGIHECLCRLHPRPTDPSRSHLLFFPNPVAGYLPARRLRTTRGSPISASCRSTAGLPCS